MEVRLRTIDCASRPLHPGRSSRPRRATRLAKTSLFPSAHRVELDAKLPLSRTRREDATVFERFRTCGSSQIDVRRPGAAGHPALLGS